MWRWAALLVAAFAATATAGSGWREGFPPLVRAVNYQFVPPGEGRPLSSLLEERDPYRPELRALLANHLSLVARMGFNAVRLWSMHEGVDHSALLGLLAARGLRAIVTFDPLFGIARRFVDVAALSALERQLIERRWRLFLRRFQGHGATLAYALSNEVNRLAATPAAFRSFLELAARLGAIREQECAGGEAAPCWHPITIPFADDGGGGDGSTGVGGLMHRLGEWDAAVWNASDFHSVQVYRGATFGGLFGAFRRAYWDRRPAGSRKPLLVSEFGMDALDLRLDAGRTANETAQAEALSALWAELHAAAAVDADGMLLGGAVFEFADEWWKGGSPAATHPAHLGCPHAATAHLRHSPCGFRAPGAAPDGVFSEAWFGLFAHADDPLCLRPRRAAYAVAGALQGRDAADVRLCGDGACCAYASHSGLLYVLSGAGCMLAFAAAYASGRRWWRRSGAAQSPSPPRRQKQRRPLSGDADEEEEEEEEEEEGKMQGEQERKVPSKAAASPTPERYPVALGAQQLPPIRAQCDAAVGRAAASLRSSALAETAAALRLHCAVVARSLAALLAQQRARGAGRRLAAVRVHSRVLEAYHSWCRHRRLEPAVAVAALATAHVPTLLSEAAEFLLVWASAQHLRRVHAFVSARFHRVRIAALAGDRHGVVLPGEQVGAESHPAQQLRALQRRLHLLQLNYDDVELRHSGAALRRRPYPRRGGPLALLLVFWPALHFTALLDVAALRLLRGGGASPFTGLLDVLALLLRRPRTVLLALCQLDAALLAAGQLLQTAATATVTARSAALALLCAAVANALGTCLADPDGGGGDLAGPPLLPLCPSPLSPTTATAAYAVGRAALLLLGDCWRLDRRLAGVGLLPSRLPVAADPRRQRCARLCGHCGRSLIFWLVVVAAAVLFNVRVLFPSVLHLSPTALCHSGAAGGDFSLPTSPALITSAIVALRSASASASDSAAAAAAADGHPREEGVGPATLGQLLPVEALVRWRRLCCDGFVWLAWGTVLLLSFVALFVAYSLTTAAAGFLLPKLFRGAARWERPLLRVLLVLLALLVVAALSLGAPGSALSLLTPFAMLAVFAQLLAPGRASRWAHLAHSVFGGGLRRAFGVLYATAIDDAEARRLWARIVAELRGEDLLDDACAAELRAAVCGAAAAVPSPQPFLRAPADVRLRLQSLFEALLTLRKKRRASLDLNGLRSVSVVIPFYQETVSYTRGDLLPDTLGFLAGRYPLQWCCLWERLRRQAVTATAGPQQLLAAFAAGDTADGCARAVCRWATMRGQTLERTLRGTANGFEALRFFAEHELRIGGPSGRGAAIAAFCARKYQVVLAAQVYGARLQQRRQRRQLNALLREFHLFLTLVYDYDEAADLRDALSLARRCARLMAPQAEAQLAAVCGARAALLETLALLRAPLGPGTRPPLGPSPPPGPAADGDAAELLQRRLLPALAAAGASRCPLAWPLRECVRRTAQQLWMLHRDPDPPALLDAVGALEGVLDAHAALDAAMVHRSHTRALRRLAAALRLEQQQFCGRVAANDDVLWEAFQQLQHDDRGCGAAPGFGYAPVAAFVEAVASGLLVGSGGGEADDAREFGALQRRWMQWLLHCFAEVADRRGAAAADGARLRADAAELLQLQAQCRGAARRASRMSILEGGLLLLQRRLRGAADPPPRQLQPALLKCLRPREQQRQRHQRRRTSLADALGSVRQQLAESRRELEAARTAQRRCCTAMDTAFPPCRDCSDSDGSGGSGGSGGAFVFAAWAPRVLCQLRRLDAAWGHCDVPAAAEMARAEACAPPPFRPLLRLIRQADAVARAARHQWAPGDMEEQEGQQQQQQEEEEEQEQEQGAEGWIERAVAIGGFSHYSVQLGATPGGELRVLGAIPRTHALRLGAFPLAVPRHPELRLPAPASNAKSENQSHALLFADGEVLQTLDMNQYLAFAEALRWRHLLHAFRWR